MHQEQLILLERSQEMARDSDRQATQSELSEARKKVKEAEDKAETSRLDVIQLLKEADELREASCLAAEVSEKARAEATSSKNEMEKRLQE